jgi:para-aminobenzoate synthetase component 1
MRKFIQLGEAFPGFEPALCSWASEKKIACILKSNRDFHSVPDAYSNFETCIAVEAAGEMEYKISAFESLKHFHERKKDWLFGYLSYDLKNETEDLTSENEDGLKFQSVHFFQPRFVFLQRNGNWEAGYLEEIDSDNSITEIIEMLHSRPANEGIETQAETHPRVSKEKYLENIDVIKKHIRRGDIYEMNYCVEFYAEQAAIQPLNTFEKLNGISPMPFSCFYKNNDQHLICASPERFIAKRGLKIISQPIKGTAARGKSYAEDEGIKLKLRNDAKEQSENVMIVDLVRNDLSRTAAKGSVKVEELFGIYSFRQLHQMISTVVSEIRRDVHWTDVVRNAFPMGSMTGAPKIRAMQLIEGFEETKRGLYSGAVGYVTPSSDFDFNVVIRSILYNASLKYLSFMVGSAITMNADPEKEYDECMLKAKSMMQVLQKEKLEKVS